MTTARAIIRDVSRYLTDQELGFEFTHWTEDDLFTYLKYALSIIAASDKSKHTKQREVKLQAGSLQNIPDTCSDARIVGTKNAQGYIVPARKISKDPMAAIDRPLCVSKLPCGTAYTMRTWAQSDSDSGTFWVTPPVPESEEVTVVMSCFEVDTPANLDEELHLNPEYEAVIFELMLYYAFGVDIESVAMRERSESHFNKAYTILGVALTAAGTRKKTK